MVEYEGCKFYGVGLVIDIVEFFVCVLIYVINVIYCVYKVVYLKVKRG